MALLLNMGTTEALHKKKKGKTETIQDKTVKNCQKPLAMHSHMWAMQLCMALHIHVLSILLSAEALHTNEVLGVSALHYSTRSTEGLEGFRR